MANPVLPLFDLYPPQERYELSSGIRCDVPYVCRGADLLVLHGSAELSKVVPLLTGQRYQPVSIGGGRCAAALWFADYHDTSCGAYREFIVTFAVSARTLEIPVSSPAGLAAVAAHPEATLLVHRLILNQSVPIEYGREVHGMNKYPTPQPLNIDFGAQGCRFDVSCERQPVVAGHVGLPQEAAPVQRLSLGFVTGAALFQTRGVFHFDLQTRFRAFADGDALDIGDGSEAGRELRGIGFMPQLVQFLPAAAFVMPKPLNWQARDDNQGE